MHLSLVCPAATRRDLLHSFFLPPHHLTARCFELKVTFLILWKFVVRLRCAPLGLFDETHQLILSYPRVWVVGCSGWVWRNIGIIQMDGWYLKGSSSHSVLCEWCEK